MQRNRPKVSNDDVEKSEAVLGHSELISLRNIFFLCVSGVKWSHLTLTEKKLADIKSSTSGMGLGDKDDPSAGLMNIMKNMYDSGDSDTKRMIAKAWTEGQQKQREGGNPAADMF